MQPESVFTVEEKRKLTIEHGHTLQILIYNYDIIMLHTKPVANHWRSQLKNSQKWSSGGLQ